MSDNFLSFVGKVGQPSADNVAEKPTLATTKAAQTTDFKKIFAKEAVSPESAGEVQDSGLDEVKVAQTNAIEDLAEQELDSTVTPLGLPVASDNGNPLPKLSIYTPGLQVGRVILTTSNPRVNEDSLTAFARAQGISEAVLKQTQVAGQNQSGQPAEIAGLKTEAPPSILSGLLSNSALQRNPVEGAAVVEPADAPQDLAAANKVADDTLSALRVQQAFGLSKPDAKSADSRTGGGELVNPLAATMLGAHDLRAQRQQTIREGHSADAGKEFSDLEVDGIGKDLEIKVLPEKSSISDLRQARQAIDSAMEFARVNVQNGVENISAPGAGDSTIAATSTLSAPPVSALQGAAPSAAPVATSLGAVLSANDPSLMQARMQPYQDWAEKFGEVLGQKLSLAVKQGTWAVKLNLNPHSLGEIAIALEVGEKGIEGQLSANDGAVRQLLSDALPKLRASLEDLMGQNGSVNIEVGDDEASKGKQSSGDMVEIAIDLEEEIFSGSKVIVGSGITLRDGFDVLV
jgi:flagellar hook-length control protein FliK